MTMTFDENRTPAELAQAMIARSKAKADAEVRRYRNARKLRENTRRIRELERLSDALQGRREAA